MIDRLTVRADHVHVFRRKSSFVERRQAGSGKRLADSNIQLRNPSNVEVDCPQDLAPHLGVVQVLLVVHKLGADVRPTALHSADGDID
jgi:hypothetical protein